MNSAKVFTLIFLILQIIAINCLAQSDCIVEPGKIPQKQVRKMFQEESLCQAQDFASLRPLCYDESDSTAYRKHFRSFLVEADLEKVWRVYTSISPKDIWRGDMVTFGCQYYRGDNTITYLNDHFEGLNIGQVLFMNLRLLGGLINIPVSHEIMEVNEKEYYIKICYLEKGAAQGTQWIRFSKTPEGFTRVDHETRYRSNSRFRDKYLYPSLHGKAIAEFHRHIRDRVYNTIP